MLLMLLGSDGERWVVVQAVTSSAAQSAGVSPTWAQSAGAIPTGEAFDWQGDQPLRLPQVSVTQESHHLCWFGGHVPLVHICHRQGSPR